MGSTLDTKELEKAVIKHKTFLERASQPLCRLPSVAQPYMLWKYFLVVNYYTEDWSALDFRYISDQMCEGRK